MKNKKTFSFDEERDAEITYYQGFPNKTIDYNKMYLIAKYIRQTYDLGEIRLEKELIKYCLSQDEYFNPVVEEKAIRKWVKSAMNYNLRKIEGIHVSQKEIDFLKNIKTSKERKLLFSILIFSKALKKGNVKRDKKNLRTSNNYYIHYNNFQDIIRISKLMNMNDTDLADVIHNHKECFSFYKPEKELLRLEYVDKNPEKEIFITDMNNISNYYNILFETQKAPAICKNCGKEIIKTNNKQKYCKECAKLINREQHKLLMRKRRAEYVTK